MSDTVVITPTIGRDSLLRSIKSVQSQTVVPEHLIVVDGEKHLDKVNKVLSKVKDKSNITIMVVPYATGANGYWGHRIIAGVSQFVDHEYILLLDDDNWYHPAHVESLTNLVKNKNLDWAFSLRRLWTWDLRLGYYDTGIAIGDICDMQMPGGQIVDTSTYCFSNKFFKENGHHWFGGFGADRHFFQNVAINHPHDSTMLHTLNFELDKSYFQSQIHCYMLNVDLHEKCQHAYSKDNSMLYNYVKGK